MTAALIFVGVVVVVMIIAVAVVFAPGDWGASRCTGDALSGFLPCDRYPDCDC